MRWKTNMFIRTHSLLCLVWLPDTPYHPLDLRYPRQNLLSICLQHKRSLVYTGLPPPVWGTIRNNTLNEKQLARSHVRFSQPSSGCFRASDPRAGTFRAQVPSPHRCLFHPTALHEILDHYLFLDWVIFLSGSLLMKKKKLALLNCFDATLPSSALAKQPYSSAYR